MKKFLISSTVVLLLGLLAYYSTYTVDEREAVVVTQFGEPVRTVTDSGLHFKRPGFLQKVNRFDKRLQVYETEAIQMLLGDKNPLIVGCYAAWKISDPLLFFQTIGLDNEQGARKVGDILNSQLGGVISEYSIGNIINTDSESVKLTEIEQKVQRLVTENSEPKYGIRVERVGISRLAYPAIVVSAVYDRMRSERNKEAEKIKAEGREVADKIRADAAKEAAEITSQAQKEALIIRGEGEKEALRIYREAYGSDPEFFDFLNSIELYKKVLGNNTVMVLSTQSDLFKYLDMGKEAVTGPVKGKK